MYILSVTLSESTNAKGKKSSVNNLSLSTSRVKTRPHLYKACMHIKPGRKEKKSVVKTKVRMFQKKVLRTLIDDQAPTRTLSQVPPAVRPTDHQDLMID